MKKLTAILLTLAMLLSFAGCISQEDLDSAVNDATAPLKEQITALEADIAAKEAKIETLEGEKAALTEEKTELEGEIDEIDAQLATLNGKVAELEASGEADEAEINKLQEDISALEGKKTELTASVAELEASISAKDTEITNLNSSIETLTAEKQTLSDRIAALEKENEALENEKSELEKENEGLKNCLAGTHDYQYTVNEDGTHTGDCLWCDDTVTENHSFDADGKCVCGDSATLVGTVDELKAAVKQGGIIKLGGDIDLGDTYLEIPYGKTVTLDLNGFTLSGSYQNQVVCNIGMLTITDSGADGKITATGSIDCVYSIGTSLIVEDGTITHDSRNAVCVDDGTVEIKGEAVLSGSNGLVTGPLCTSATVTGGVINGAVVANGNQINISGGHINGLLWTMDEGSFSVTGGTFVNDPSDYVDTENYTVNNNGDGTWTVVSGAAGDPASEAGSTVTCEPAAEEAILAGDGDSGNTPNPEVVVTPGTGTGSPAVEIYPGGIVPGDLVPVNPGGIVTINPDGSVSGNPGSGSDSGTVSAIFDSL